ncbi:acyltransferase domain-containing protein [Amycolatopsis sp. OK19-0408]|uniref:Acyltransferase domain-containing protein n=1 Tax=Amycolatopsis iheyensis TaxID=2945988 RepID=A0A9X2NGI3_9PSEU|nr:type I polyketide synthase [Amycolatopsis iheyensis]MCR6487407.1 acyltransferase domain-containing protein [Amycolatopsis iheyensis]
MILKTSTNHARQTPAEQGVAIVGAGCRLPGAATPAQFWEVLRTGQDTVTEVPDDRFDVDRWFSPETGKPHSIRSRSGGFLDRIDQFDAPFFGILPNEAEQMDPQQRMLLEVAWQALEDAGRTAAELAGSNTGVYVNMCNSGYWDLLRAAGRHDLHAAMGGEAGGMAAGRIAYHLDARGPVMALESTCATALAAVHVAGRALRSGDIDLAIVGGANLLLTPDLYFALSEAEMLSPTGRCRFGDADADGYVRSEGAVVLVLKRQEDADADGDRTYATIIGTAVRGDGRSGGTLTTPGVAGQEAMLRAAYEDAGVSPADVDFVEAHGPGTPAGDPVELEALATVLGEERDPARPCLVGSAKSNIGHLEGAGGVVGLLKAALALHHRELPRTLHVRTPLAVFDEGPLRLARERTPLTPIGRPALAGVSAFGLSGGYAHAVLSEAPSTSMSPGRRAAEALPAARQDGPAARRGSALTAPATRPAEPPPYLLPLSAKTSTALRTLAAATAELLSTPDGPAAADVCHTAGTRRTHFERRVAVVGRDRAELADELIAVAGGRGSGPGPVQPPRVVFVFPGQGSQWPGMGRELLRTDPVFAARLGECDRAVCDETGFSVLDALEPGRTLSTMDEVQPVLWAVQVALAASWRARGIEPDLLVGHSMGEVAAAVTAGALTVAEGAAVICRRSGLLARRRTPGAMWAVQLGEEPAARAIGAHADRVCVGVVNSPHATVLSGDPGALAEVVAPLRATGVRCSQVQVDYASHAPQVAPLCPDIERSLDGLRPRPGRVPLHSTVLDRVLDGAELDGRYWADNLRLPVRFAGAVGAVLADPRPVVFVEISPHPILHSAIEDGIEAAGRTATVIGSLERDRPEAETMLRALAIAYAAGCDPDWARLTAGGTFVPLPGYPWQGERHWVDDGGAWTSPVIALPGRQDPPAESRDRLRGGPSTPEECAEDLLRRTSALLGVDTGEVDLAVPLTHLGMNSLFAVKLAYQLRSDLDIAISVRELLQAPSIAGLAAAIHDRLPDAVGAGQAS